jgi:hypothetical protein
VNIKICSANGGISFGTGKRRAHHLLKRGTAFDPAGPGGPEQLVWLRSITEKQGCTRLHKPLSPLHVFAPTGYSPPNPVQVLAALRQASGERDSG